MEKINSRKRNFLMREWYCHIEIQNKIIQYTQQRETVFLLSSAERIEGKKVNMRYVSMNKAIDLSFQIRNTFKLYDTPRLYNIYYSIAHFKRFFPYFKFGECRRETISRWVKNTMCNIIDHVDFFIDIDTSRQTFEAGKETLKQIRIIFDKFNITYEVRLSGRGIHIIAEGKQFAELKAEFTEDLLNKNNIMNYYYKIARYFNKNISELVDLAVYDLRRVTKAGYSLVHYPEELKVVLPLCSEDEILKCDYDYNSIIQVKELLENDFKNINKRKTFKVNEHIKSKVKELIKFVE